MASQRNLIFEDKEAQAWGIDLMAAMVIFIVAITVFFIYSLNQSGEVRSIIEDLSYDGKILSNDLVSEGYPNDWNEVNVLKIGLTNDGKINQTKLERFYSFSQNNYEKTKIVFNLKYNYYFFLDENMTISSSDDEDMTISSSEVEGIGKPGVDKDYIENNASNLIKITRLMIYENKPVIAYVYIWEEGN